MAPHPTEGCAGSSWSAATYNVNVKQLQDAPSIPPSPMGRSGPRSRSGCWTCRGKKVKCDEVRPNCRRCLRLGLTCDYARRARRRAKHSSSPRPPSSFERVLSFLGSDLSASPPSDASALASSDTSTLAVVPRSPIDSDSEAQSNDDRPSSSSSQLDLQVLPHPFSSPSPPSIAPCGFTLDAAHHEAIDFFRNTFAPLYHTKTPAFSLFSIMLKVARDDPLVMHMILALGGREIDGRLLEQQHQRNEHVLDKDIVRAETQSKHRYMALRHYSAALRIMADVIGRSQEYEEINLDSVMNAVFLMALYELLHGDDRYQGINNHLVGGAHIVRQHCSSLLRNLANRTHHAKRRTRAEPLATRTQASGEGMVSQFSARILSYLTDLDSQTSNIQGVESPISNLLNHLTRQSESTEHMYWPSTLAALDGLGDYTDSLYRLVWGDDYPQYELMDDMENRKVFKLRGACMQLRYMNGRLSAAMLSNAGKEAIAGRAESMKAALKQVEEDFAELFVVASKLTVETGSSHRLIANIRWIVSLYHGEALEYLRVTQGMDSDLELDERQRHSLRLVMSLAVQAYRLQGKVAMLRVARPLFIAALETDDIIHREWIMQRFDELKEYGRNCRRARVFLGHAIAQQQRLGRRIDVGRMLLESRSWFVLIS